ncbi:MAG: hypothetical protein GY711_29665 [bacterium]|nr:hypothetical protein [bacterium]
MTSRHAALLLVLMMGLLAAPSTAERGVAFAQDVDRATRPTPPAPLSADECDEVLDWFESLDHPILEDGRLVWVTTHRDRRLGVLLEPSVSDDAPTSEVPSVRARRPFVSLDLMELDLDQLGGGGLKVQPASGVAKALDAWMFQLEPPNDTRRMLTTLGRLSQRGHLVVAAALCRKHGLHERATRALAEAAVRTGPHDERGLDPELTLLERVMPDFELAARRSAWLSFGTFADRRQLFLDYARRFPETRYTARAEAHAAVLATMASEEASAPSADDVALLQRSAPVGQVVDEVVDALVFRMRYAAGVRNRMSWPVSIDRVADGAYAPVTERLRALGDAALPRLVAHCTDETLLGTTLEGMVNPMPRQATVGELCTGFVAEISGEEFVCGSHARAWWAAKQADREPAELIRTVLDWETTESDAALRAARTLIERHPQLAFHAIDAAAHTRGGAAQALEDRLPWTRLLATLAEIDDETRRRVVSRLTLGASSGRLTHRAGAVLALAPLDPPAALRAARVIWREMPDARVMSREMLDASHAPRSWSGWLGAQKVIRFLVAQRQLELIAERVSRQHGNVRLWTATAVGAAADLEVQRELPAQLLVQLLADREVVPGAWDLSGTDVTDPRVCDAVAAALAARMPKRFRFDPKADVKGRNAAIERLLETLR